MFQEACAKQRNARGTATEDAIGGGNATEHAASAADIKDSPGLATERAKAMLDTGGNATERALSASGSKDPRFHKMFLEACSKLKKRHLVLEASSKKRHARSEAGPAHC